MIVVLRKYKFFIATGIFTLILLAVIIGLFSIDNSTNRMVVEYVNGLGWEIESSPVEISYLKIPEIFDPVYDAYNTVQMKSGFNLTDFKGRNIARYSYRVLNHVRSAETEVIVNVFVYDSRIIAADICSAAKDGFMHGITETGYIK